jgi:translation initiation factor IF-1
MVSSELEFDGVVISDCKGKFTIQVSDKYIVLCTLSGKIRQNGVRILPHDRVKISVSEYNPQMGRIIYRYKD